MHVVLQIKGKFLPGVVYFWRKGIGTGRGHSAQLTSPMPFFWPDGDELPFQIEPDTLKERIGAPRPQNQRTEGGTK